MNNSESVKVYHGYGHKHNLVVYGHAFKYKAKVNQVYSNNLLVNIIHLLKLFFLKPLPFAKVRLRFGADVLDQCTEYDGFFKFEWASAQDIAAGWHDLQVDLLSDEGVVLASSGGKLYVPHITQYAFISDIDDTVMVSHSSTILRRLKELFVKNPRTRKTFRHAQQHYDLLSKAHTSAEQPNPFFYVSSSEWNLYDYLLETFRYNKLPEGTFLLNQIKQWQNLIKTGKTGHEGKLLRVMRILDAFPNQQFVFFGDNSQQDPQIYTTIAGKYPANIYAIYIRNVVDRKLEATQHLLQAVEAKGVKTFVFKDSSEAIAHSRSIGLLS